MKNIHPLPLELFAKLAKENVSCSPDFSERLMALATQEQLFPAVEILDYKNGKEVLDLVEHAGEILVTHFTVAIPSDSYINSMVERLDEGTLQAKRIIFYNETQPIECYKWLKMFRNKDETLIRGYDEFTFTGKPLPFDMAVYDREKVVLRFPEHTKDERYTNIILINDVDAAMFFANLFQSLMDPENNHVYGFSGVEDEYTNYPSERLIKYAGKPEHFRSVRERVVQLNGDWEGFAIQLLKKGDKITHPISGNLIRVLNTKTYSFQIQMHLSHTTDGNIEGQGVVILDFEQLGHPKEKSTSLNCVLKGHLSDDKLSFSIIYVDFEEYGAHGYLMLESDSCLHGAFKGDGLLSARTINGPIALVKTGTSTSTERVDGNTVGM